MTHVKRLAMIAIFAILATACSVQKPQPGAQSPAQLKGERQRAANLISQAQSALPGDAAALRIEAAAIYYTLGEYQRSADILNSVNSDGANVTVLFDLNLLKARNAIATGQAQAALDYLSVIEQDELFSAMQNSEKYLVGASAHGLLLDNAAQLQSLITASEFISDSERARELNENIWQSAQSLNEQQLSALDNPEASYTQRGWFALLNNLRTYPGAEKLQANIWQRSWSTHSAAKFPPSALASYLEKVPLENSAYSLNHIAIALPQSGKYAKAASAIKNGIQLIAATRPELQISHIDTTNMGDASEIINQATQLNADMVIGPLNKDLVGQLTQYGNLSIPTLALNSTVIGAGNLYQLSLSSEGEARDAAVRAFNDGRRNMLILTSSDDKGQQAANAFAQQFNALGGQVLSTTLYNTQEGNVTNAVAQMLQINQGRVRALQKKMKTGQLRHAIKSMRRKDADGIFLIASLGDAIQIGPSISYFYASDMPLYSTSKIFT
ncbi:MAG: penicillin-binding protein activator, partial [Pseudomonadales bacterium]